MAPSAGVLLILIFFGKTVNADQDLDLDNDNVMDVKVSENKEHDFLGKHQTFILFVVLSSLKHIYAHKNTHYNSNSIF